MSNSNLKPNEVAELDFLRWLDTALAGYCGETTDFRARKLAGDFGAKHLARLHTLEQREQEALDVTVEEPLAIAASQQPVVR